MGNVKVYESRHSNLSQAISFDYPGATKNLYVIYKGGKHYDALVPKAPPKPGDWIWRAVIVAAVPILGDRVYRRFLPAGDKDFWDPEESMWDDFVLRYNLARPWKRLFLGHLEPVDPYVNEKDGIRWLQRPKDSRCPSALSIGLLAGSGVALFLFRLRGALPS